MKLYKPLFFLMMVVLLTSFSSDRIETIFLINKVWVYDHYDEKTQNMVFKSSNFFSKNKTGFKFLNNGKVNIRQDVFMCGTPPIIYETIDGNWERTSDSVVVVERKRSRDLKMIEKFKIIDLTKKTLVIKNISYE